MLKKAVISLTFILVLIGMIGLNTGFFNEKVDMSNIKIPDAFLMMGNQDEEQMTNLQTQLQKLQKIPGAEEKQNKISNELQQIAIKDTIQSYDKAFLTKLFGDIQKATGYVNNNTILKPRSGRVYAMQFGYNNGLTQNSMDDLINNLKEGYIPQIYIFPNDTVLVPMYSEKSSNKVSTVEVKLSEELVSYIDSYYQNGLKKK